MNSSQRFNALKNSIFTMLYRDKALYNSLEFPLIELGIGLIDFSPSNELISKLIDTFNIKHIHDYPNTNGEDELLKAIAVFYKKHYNVDICYDNNISIFHGSKEGISKIAFAFTDENDMVLVPNPAYAIFEQSSLLANNNIYYLPLLESNDFFPDFNNISSKVLNETKVLYLNYPNVPTTANTSYQIFKEAIDLAEKYNFLVVNDATYSNIFYDKHNKPISILSIEGALDRAIEFNSFSQIFRIAGWRLGYAIGSQENISILKKIEDTLDSGVFKGFQQAVSNILSSNNNIIPNYNFELKKSRDVLFNLLKNYGFDPIMPETTYYMWVKLPKHLKSIEAYNIFKEYGVLIMPGNGFGKYGEGYIRFCFARNYRTIENIESRLNLIRLKCQV